MPNIVAPAILKAPRYRPIHDGKLHSVSETITIPSGTLFASGNTIRLFRIDPSKVIPVRFILDASGPFDGNGTAASRTMAGTMGYLLSVNRAGTNLSFTLDANGNPTTTAASASAANMLAAATQPVIANGAPLTSFGTAGAAGWLSSGGTAVFNALASGLDSRGYDANVVDVAITLTANSSTATTAAIVASIVMEFAAVGRAPAGGAFATPYVYDSRYSLTTQTSS